MTESRLNQLSRSRLTPFAEILRQAVERTGAIGGAFADADGEMVDSYTAAAVEGSASFDAHDWAVLTAHYGVLLSQLESFFDTLHYGGTEVFIAQHAKLDVVVCTVDDGYYALIAKPRSDSPDAILDVLPPLEEAARALKKEMS